MYLTVQRDPFLKAYGISQSRRGCIIVVKRADMCGVLAT